MNVFFKHKKNCYENLLDWFTATVRTWLTRDIDNVENILFFFHLKQTNQKIKTLFDRENRLGYKYMYTNVFFRACGKPVFSVFCMNRCYGKDQAMYTNVKQVVKG